MATTGFLMPHPRTGQTCLPSHKQCWTPVGSPMEPVPEKTLQHGGVERACFLQAGRTKRKTGKGQVRDAQFLLQTNQSGESLLSERKNKGDERERGPWGIAPMDPLCMQQELSAPPTVNLIWLVCALLVLQFWKKNLPLPAKQSEVTNGDVNHSWKWAASILEHPQEDPASHSAHGRMGFGRSGIERGQLADP